MRLTLFKSNDTEVEVLSGPHRLPKTKAVAKVKQKEQLPQNTEKYPMPGYIPSSHPDRDDRGKYEEIDTDRAYESTATRVLGRLQRISLIALIILLAALVVCKKIESYGPDPVHIEPVHFKRVQIDCLLFLLGY